MLVPAIRKVGLVVGHSLRFREVTPDDAAFILALRTDPATSRHLSPVCGGLAAQVAWLEAYAERAAEAYYLIQTRAGRSLGTVRLYDPREDSFEWGSWILARSAPVHASVESAMMVWRLGLTFGFTRGRFSVRRANGSVLRFHRACGAEEVGGDPEQLHFVMSHEAIQRTLDRFQRVLPTGITLAA